MKKLLSLLLIICSQQFVFGQEEMKDVENCKDHPLFTRMPNTYITECQSNFDEVEIHMSADNVVKKEGNKTSINYTYNYDSKVAPPSFLQIVKNYENALAKYGGKRIFFGKEQGVGTLFFKNDGKDTWITISDFGGVGAGQYGLTILEMEPMKQDITATAILDELNKSGKVALYINFETGKSTIKPESMNIVDQIAEMLQSDPALKVSVEGHTDNVGTPATNKILSENRAKALVAALLSKGIDKSRLSAKGWGQEKPIADNSSEDGKAKNRRVEIVKM